MILDLLKYVCNMLDEEEIPYMISGSLAYNLYSIPRMTRDIDFVIHIEKDKIDTFIEIFKNRFYYDENTIKKEITKKGFFNVIDTKTGYKIDFIVRKDDEYRIIEFKRRYKTNELGFEAWIVTIEDLIISKIIWIQHFQSEKQIMDINNLLQNSNIDLEYIKLWIKKLNLKSFNLVL